MKHDMTQPVIDLHCQCRRCGTKFKVMDIVNNDPREQECPGFSLKHWFWRKKQNLLVMKAWGLAWSEVRKHMNLWAFFKVFRENRVRW